MNTMSTGKKNLTQIMNANCDTNTVNQQILAAIKFGVSQNKVIWRLLNLASPLGPSLQCTIDVYVGGDKYWRKHAIRQIRQI